LSTWVRLASLVETQYAVVFVTMPKTGMGCRVDWGLADFGDTAPDRE
jgi:hypothetical protein